MPSWEVHKTVHRVFTTIGSALLSRSFMIICVRVQTILKSVTGAYFIIMSHIVTVQLLYGPTLSPYSYFMVTFLYRTVAVRLRHGTVDRAKQQRKIYLKALAVWWTHGTVLWLYADTDNHILPIRPVEADPTVVKTLGTVLCSSRDGVPLKWKKENGRPGSLKISIDWYHFWPLLAVIGQYL